jgi:hypothetical protein
VWIDKVRKSEYDVRTGTGAWIRFDIDEAIKTSDRRKSFNAKSRQRTRFPMRNDMTSDLVKSASSINYAKLNMRNDKCFGQVRKQHKLRKFKQTAGASPPCFGPCFVALYVLPCSQISDLLLK